MKELEEVIELLLNHVTKQSLILEKPLLESLGHITSSDIIADNNIPHFAKSAMDGYAIISSDTIHATKEHPVTLEVIGQINAGESASYLGQSGTAVRIMTGAQIPGGFDSVIKQESTDYGTKHVNIYTKVKSTENISPIGEDVKAGTKVLSAYTILSSAHIGILASLGLDKIKVLSPMKIAILSTGDELVSPGTPLSQGKQYSSCNYAIAAALLSAGVDVVANEICLDNLDSIGASILDMSKKADLIITTGGVSVGQKDLVPVALEKIGATTIFQGIKMKPGTPTMAAVVNNTPVICLSGNPFASYVCFELLFWPVLSKFMNCICYEHVRQEITLKGGDMKSSDKRRFVRGMVKNGNVYMLDKHQSTVFSNMVHCNCLIEQPANETLKEGDCVEILYTRTHGSIDFLVKKQQG